MAIAGALVLSFPLPAKAASSEGVFGNFMGQSDLSGFSSLEKDIYNYLKKQIIAVANGTAKAEDVETIYGNVKGISTVFTMTNRNVASLRTLANTGNSDVIIRDLRNINTSKIIEALMNDCPYELYWFNRQTNTEYELSGTVDNPVLRYTMKLGVGSDFAVKTSGMYYNDAYVALSSVELADRAIRNAKNIVSANTGKSDYAKLFAYKQAICDMNTYNAAAAQSAYQTSLINPWEFTSVLDGDDSTNGVCEAYSKAFKLLCDLSDFSSPNVKAYLVSGTMSGEMSGSVDHMWNIVTMENGENYLVDVTNCDDGSIGSPDKLFLGPDESVPTGSPYSGYRVDIEHEGYYPTWVGYTYASDTFASVSASVLTLSTAVYNPYQSGTYSGASTKLSLPEVTTVSVEEASATVASTGTGGNDSNSTSDSASATRDVTAVTTSQINSIKLASTNGSVKRGKTKKITLSSTADTSVIKKISYKSLNTRVAKVSSKGKITGLRKGKAKIRVTVTLTNGAKKYFTYTITVK